MPSSILTFPFHVYIRSRPVDRYRSSSSLPPLSRVFKAICSFRSDYSKNPSMACRCCAAACVGEGALFQANMYMIRQSENAARSMQNDMCRMLAGTNKRIDTAMQSSSVICW